MVAKTPNPGRDDCASIVNEPGLVMHDRQPQLRESAYDLDAATAELRDSGFGVESQLAESLREPVDPDWVTAFFEHGVGRRSDPGPPRPAKRS